MEIMAVVFLVPLLILMVFLKPNLKKKWACISGYTFILSLLVTIPAVVYFYRNRSANSWQHSSWEDLITFLVPPVSLIFLSIGIERLIRRWRNRMRPKKNGARYRRYEVFFAGMIFLQLISYGYALREQEQLQKRPLRMETAPLFKKFTP